MNIELIKKKCAERQITFAELERATGIGNGVIGKWAKSANGASAVNIKKVADYLGCTIDELMREESK